MSTTTVQLDVQALRAQFPLLSQEPSGRRLIYLDSAATTQKPERVLEAMDRFYREKNANVHRGVHTLSQRATDAFDEARAAIASFIGARDPNELIFTKGCTEAINLVAASWGRQNLRPGDEILLSAMEHHANIVPWQIVAQQTGARVRPIPISDEGVLDLRALEEMLSERTRLVGLVHVSNALGTINPVAEVVRMARAVGALTLIDGAQALAHEVVDVNALGVDFYAISGHKAYGPTGVGALYGRRELLEAMPPYQSGGDMIRTVSFDKTTFAGIPNKFEPGTPNIAGAIGFGEATRFLTEMDRSAIQAHEGRLMTEASRALSEIEGVKLIGTAPHKAAIVGFTVEGVHPHDVGTVLNDRGVAIRTGHHCCMPLMARLGVSGTSRASFAPYNTLEEVAELAEAVSAAARLFS